MRLIQVFFPLLILLAAGMPAVFAEEIRDYYSEPGLNPFKQGINDNFNESIDPFSGGLSHVYTDVVVPGNGGMDIRVSRVYNSINEQVGTRRVTGVGWTMHFGRIVVPAAHASKICSQQLWSVTVVDNPSIEFADGGRELLVLNVDGSGSLITKSNWKAECVDGQPGIVVTSPDGTVFIMDEFDFAQDEPSWYTSRIQDTNGNIIDISYISNPNGYRYIDTITGSVTLVDGTVVPDGRLVQFEYLDALTDSIRLSKITSNNQTWEYKYTPIPGIAGNYFHLTEVLRPDGLSWNYEYYPQFFTSEEAGGHSLKTVTYPHGGTITYTYTPTQFDVTDFNTRTTTVATKVTSGREVASGTWTYAYAPDSVPTLDDPTRNFDVTTVVAPNGTTKYFHTGYGFSSTSTVWSVGLLFKKEVYELDGTLIDVVVTDWGTRLISNENYWHGRDPLKIDNETYAPVRTRVQHFRQGVTYDTQFSNFDIYGNPGTISESSNIVGDSNRITHITYFSDPVKWIISKPEDETIETIGTVDRTYDPNGNLIFENRYGVITTFTYTAQGDVETRTDARSNSVNFSDYHRGIAQREDHPESVVILRTVNDTGTVASETNGRGFTRQFSYDGLNRLTGITFPINAPVIITYSATGKSLTRSNLQEDVTVDGFGRQIQSLRLDTLSTESVTQTTEYDALGQAVFESYPNSLQGVTSTYDVLGRLRRLEHPDGAFRAYDIGDSGNVVTETNERGFNTVYIYRAYGNPDAKALLQIEAPENVITIISRNKLDLIEEVFQGNSQTLAGFVRTYTYDTKFFLTEAQDPETGTTLFGRDEVGNMTSRQVGTSGVTQFQYDGLNRLTFVDYPGTTADITRIYDNNGNVAYESNVHAARDRVFDQNDNLISELVTIGERIYALDYAYDQKDMQDTITYPSGRVISMSPDALGRPSQALPFLTAVTYHPSGQIKQMQYANGQVTDIELTPRLLIGRINIHGVTGIADLTYQYDAIGNVESISDFFEPAFDRSLGYDGINRLVNATGFWGVGSFSYDVFGNILSKSLGVDSDTYNYFGLQLDSIVSGGNSTDFSYDIYGNTRFVTTTDFLGAPISSKEYVFDDAGNLQLAFLNEPGRLVDHEYRYDSNGFRVSRVENAGPDETQFVYGATGNLLGEYVAADPLYGKEYIYLGSQLVASVKENEPPVANAGADQIVDGGANVTLDGSGSFDRDGSIVNYEWTQTFGVPVILNSPNSVTTSFTAPSIETQSVLIFSVAVTDDKGAVATDPVTVTVLPPNQPPVANAGSDQTVLADTSVNLDGTSSSDSDGTIEGYQWIQLAGPGVTLNNPDTATPSFIATRSLGGQDYLLTFQLTVTDDDGDTSTDSVNIDVKDPSTDDDGDGLPDGWEIIHFGDIALYDGNDDPDADGISNLQEYQEETDPNVAEPAPLAVTGVFALPGDGENVIVWQEVKSAAQYNLYWGTAPGVTASTGTLIAGVTNPFVHEGLVNGTPLYYVVTAENSAGESGISNEATATPGQRAWESPTIIGPVQARIDMDFNGRSEIVLVWNENTGSTGTVRTRRFTTAAGWGPTVDLQSGTGSVFNTKVALDDSGDALAVWTKDDGTRSNLWSSSFSAKSGIWSTPELVETYNGGSFENGDVGEVSDVAMDGSGNGVVAWTQLKATFFPDSSQGAVGANVYVNVLVPGQRWGPRTELEGSDVGDSSDLSLAVTPQGRIVVAWGRSTDVDGPDLFGPYDRNVVAAVLNPATGWTPVEIIDGHPDNRAYRPAVALDAAGNAVAVWQQSAGKNDSKNEIWTSRYDAATGTWGLLEKLASTGSGFVRPQVAMNGQGDAVAAWESSGSIRASYASSGAAWGRVKSIGGRRNSTSPQVAIDEDGNAIASWVFEGDMYAANYSIGSGWGPGLLIENQTTVDVYVHRLRMDRYGNGTVVWTEAGESYENHYRVPQP